MSETLTESPAETAQPPVTTEAPVVTETTETAPETTAEPEPAPKPKQGDRRFAIMTAKLKAEETARQTAERERDAALALANAGKEQPTQREPDVETAAARLIAQREFEARRQALIGAGTKEFSDWADKTDILHAMGATQNLAFMEAIVDSENGPKIVAHLADDADALVALLAKSPTAMATAIGRLDAKMSAPAPKKLSGAPPPAPRVYPSGVVPEADPYSYPPNMSMKEWSKMMDAHLPPSLGGKRKIA
jgi:hypothetical protein